ncbi:amidohydrolase family protein [[Mycobacterium] burgundiense]|uniref:Amidohydrolase family protein n=1 Tax=[Mycobacterium] burgundiense TaxID=3064286 RepID=A0ABM9LKF6_9MYCO|nr:amidohydrolase family protein [Mycolicibacterium sp. MU0053]CAJ1500454.1 amidohydrolase family protein [Mycolicibacterium sp. MU0053]
MQDRPHIIDVHNHLGATTSSSRGDSVDLDDELAARAATLAARGVAQAVIIASHDYLRPDGIADNRKINDGIAMCRTRRPDLFPAAVGIVEPLNGPRGLQELDRCKNELGLHGISFHTRLQGVSLDSRWVRRYLERMGELGLVPFLHSIGESSAEALWKVDVLAADFPDLPMIVLDAFSTFEQSLFAPHVAERRPQLVFDTALAHGFSVVMNLISRCGADRVMYGSDLHSSASGIPAVTDLAADILASPLTDADKAAVLGGNAARILGLQHAGTTNSGAHE